MKHVLRLLALAALLAACSPPPTPSAPTSAPALATIPADLPTTLAAFQLPAAAGQTQPAPPSSPAPAAYPAATVTPVPYMPLPPAPILGLHTAQPGETLFCIARAYGVLPSAIVQANGLTQTFSISPGQVLKIPAAQWTNIADGPVCAPQFQSPFLGLPAPTGTAPAYPAPGVVRLSFALNLNCVFNCGGKDGSYVVRLQIVPAGGLPPYGYIPAQIFDVTMPHCTPGEGSVTLLSADGQSAQASWVYDDVACP